MKSIEISQRNKQFNRLIKKIAQNDKNAFEEFYNAYARLICFAASTVTKDRFLIEEILNDILVKIWQMAESLDNINNPVGWLFTVTTNYSKDKVKASKPLNELYDIPQEDKNIERIINKDAFNSFISELNYEEQLIIIYKFVQGLSFRLIAKAMHKPQSTVSSIYYRALEKLKTTIK